MVVYGSPWLSMALYGSLGSLWLSCFLKSRSSACNSSIFEGCGTLRREGKSGAPEPFAWEAGILRTAVGVELAVCNLHVLDETLLLVQDKSLHPFKNKVEFDQSFTPSTEH